MAVDLEAAASDTAEAADTAKQTILLVTLGRSRPSDHERLFLLNQRRLDRRRYWRVPRPKTRSVRVHNEAGSRRLRFRHSRQDVQMECNPSHWRGVPAVERVCVTSRIYVVALYENFCGGRASVAIDPHRDERPSGNIDGPDCGLAGGMAHAGNRALRQIGPMITGSFGTLGPERLHAARRTRDGPHCGIIGERRYGKTTMECP